MEGKTILEMKFTKKARESVGKQCGNWRIFLPIRFYVKSLLPIFRVSKWHLFSFNNPQKLISKNISKSNEKSSGVYFNVRVISLTYIKNPTCKSMCAFFKRIPWHYVCIRKLFFSYVRKKCRKWGLLHLLFLRKVIEGISDLLKNQCQKRSWKC